MSNLMTSALPLIIGAIMLFLGIAVIIVAGRSQSRAAESQAWPTAPGTITESRLVESTSTDNDGMTSTTYRPTLRYYYEVGGKKLEGTRLNRGVQMAFDRGTANKIMARYPIGTEVSVHYNAASPSEAVLETTFRGGTAMRVIGFVFAGLGLLCMLTGIALPIIMRAFSGLFSP